MQVQANNFWHQFSDHCVGFRTYLMKSAASCSVFLLNNWCTFSLRCCECIVYEMVNMKVKYKHNKAKIKKIFTYSNVIIFCLVLHFSSTTHFSFDMVGEGAMAFNSSFNNISVKLWQSVLLVEETEVPRENQWLTNFIT